MKEFVSKVEFLFFESILRHSLNWCKNTMKILGEGGPGNLCLRHFVYSNPWICFWTAVQKNDQSSYKWSCLVFPGFFFSFLVTKGKELFEWGSFWNRIFCLIYTTLLSNFSLCMFSLSLKMRGWDVKQPIHLEWYLF